MESRENKLNGALDGMEFLLTTKTEEANGYTPIKVSIISNIKAIRLGQCIVDKENASYASYILEIFEKNEIDEKYHYVAGESYDKLDEAEKNYNNHISLGDKKQRIAKAYDKVSKSLLDLAELIAKQPGANANELKRASNIMKDAALYRDMANAEVKESHRLNIYVPRTRNSNYNPRRYNNTKRK